MKRGRALAMTDKCTGSRTVGRYTSRTCSRSRFIYTLTRWGRTIEIAPRLSTPFAGNDHPYRLDRLGPDHVLEECHPRFKVVGPLTRSVPSSFSGPNAGGDRGEEAQDPRRNSTLMLVPSPIRKPPAKPRLMRSLSSRTWAWTLLAISQNLPRRPNRLSKPIRRRREMQSRETVRLGEICSELPSSGVRLLHLIAGLPPTQIPLMRPAYTSETGPPTANVMMFWGLLLSCVLDKLRATLPTETEGLLLL